MDAMLQAAKDIKLNNLNKENKSFFMWWRTSFHEIVAVKIMKIFCSIGGLFMFLSFNNQENQATMNMSESNVLKLAKTTFFC